jgi:hypothetical protein
MFYLSIQFPRTFQTRITATLYANGADYAYQILDALTRWTGQPAIFVRQLMPDKDA